MLEIRGLEQMLDGVVYDCEIGSLTKSSLPDGYLSLLWQIPGHGDITLLYSPTGGDKIVSGHELYTSVYNAICSLNHENHGYN